MRKHLMKNPAMWRTRCGIFVGGKYRIRTCESFYTLAVFETAAFSRSANFPSSKRVRKNTIFSITTDRGVSIFSRLLVYVITIAVLLPKPISAW